MHHRPPAVLLAVASTLLLLVVGCSSDSPSPGSTEGTDGAQNDFVGLVDLGNGRSTHMECRGSGSPTVILVSGLGERADNWMITSAAPTSEEGSVFPEVAEFTRVCAYDRPGTGSETEPSRSTPVSEPATVADSAVDLDLLLTASGETGPYVLVGHSLGGPIVRLYAADHPDDVAGLVLDDALSEDLGDGLTEVQQALFDEMNSAAFQGRPDGSEDAFYVDAVVPLMRAVPTAPEVPTIVLSADQWLFTAEVLEAGHASGAIPEVITIEFTDALWSGQLAAQEQLAALFPGATHITETDAGHYIQNDNPQLVIDAIQDVVAASAPG